MKFTPSNFSRLLICGCLIVFGIASTGCKREPIDQSKDNALGEFDGLWVEQVKGGATIVPHIDIKGNTAILCKSNPIECDYTDRVHGDLQYSGITKKGKINFSDGSVLDFLCDEQGNFCSKDTVAYYRINNTLDGLQEQLNVSPKFALSADYVGPDHDLGIDLSCQTLLTASSLEAGGAWYTEMLKFAGESFAKGAISWAGGFALEKVFSCFYTDPTSKQLENILSQVTEINNKLKEIESMIQMHNFEEYINQRTNDFCIPLTNFSQRYADALIQADSTDTDTITRIVDEWYKGTIGGKVGAPIDAAANYMDFLMNTLVDQTNIYSIYDIYTFNCVPWESMGYDFRQGLRASDLALINANAQLALLYAAIHHWDTDPVYKTFVPNLNEKFQKFIKFCNDYTVNVIDDVVCQIQGAHFAMKKKLILRNYNIPPMNWYTVGSRFYHDESTTADLVYYGGMDMSAQQFKQKQITPNELTAIHNYYNDPTYSVQKIFRSAGIEVNGDILLLNGETDVDWDDRLWCYHVQFNHEGDWRYPRYAGWLSGTCHWSWFAYYFDGWKYNEAYAGATDILYRY